VQSALDVVVSGKHRPLSTTIIMGVIQTLKGARRQHEHGTMTDGT
jgi:hypothetical protein